MYRKQNKRLSCYFQKNLHVWNSINLSLILIYLSYKMINISYKMIIIKVKNKILFTIDIDPFDCFLKKEIYGMYFYILLNNYKIIYMQYKCTHREFM